MAVENVTPKPSVSDIFDDIEAKLSQASAIVHFLGRAEDADQPDGTNSWAAYAVTEIIERIDVLAWEIRDRLKGFKGVLQ